MVGRRERGLKKKRNNFSVLSSSCFTVECCHISDSQQQVNFLACQFFALLAAFWFRLYLSPSHATPLVRHAMATLLGLAFLIFCFGW